MPTAGTLSALPPPTHPMGQDQGGFLVDFPLPRVGGELEGIVKGSGKAIHSAG